MQNHKEQWSLEEMAKTLGVSRSGYYRYINAKPSVRESESRALLSRIRLIHKESRETYGSPRIYAQLQEEGEACSRKRVAKIMKKFGIEAKMNKRFKTTTRANPNAIAAPNLLQQQFKAQKPNEKWVADLTYVATDEGWLYVATVLDLFSRRIMGLAMSERITAALVSQALQQALIHRAPPANLLHHSDKGAQYTSKQFLNLLKANHIIPSMSGTGNCFDNAAMESFYHTLKTEHVYFESYKSRQEAQRSIFEYVEVFYNRKRRHSTLGYCAPMVFEENWSKQKNISLSTVH
jgi:transposase InsO family protein